MRNSLNSRRVRFTTPLTLGLCLALPALLVSLACRDITSLKQENPEELSATTLFTPNNAQLLVNSAVGDFECAYNQYVVGSGILTDELTDAFAAAGNYDYDARRLQTNAAYGIGGCARGQAPPVYGPISVARASADTILAKLEGWTDAEVPNRTRLIGESAAYAGYSLVLLGEAMCTAAINLGPELTPAQVFAEAKSRFDKAITAATAAGDATTLGFAQLGRARAELDFGDLAAAAADAALVPAGFAVNISTDAVDPLRQNGVYSNVDQSFLSSVDPSFRNVTVPGGTAPDPRVLVTNTGQAGSAGVGVWTPDKYPSFTAPITVAKYAEAQLIIAEYDASIDDLSGAAAAINNARATHTGLPVYVVPAGATGPDVLAQIIEERRREFFLEGHRLGDIRRYSLPLNPPAGAPYTIGGGTYGDQRCFPLPDNERINNPNIGATS